MLNFENLFYVSEHLYIKIPDIYLYANIIQILVKRKIVTKFITSLLFYQRVSKIILNK